MREWKGAARGIAVLGAERATAPRGGPGAVEKACWRTKAEPATVPGNQRAAAVVQTAHSETETVRGAEPEVVLKTAQAGEPQAEPKTARWSACSSRNRKRAVCRSRAR